MQFELEISAQKKINYFLTLRQRIKNTKRYDYN